MKKEVKPEEAEQTEEIEQTEETEPVATDDTEEIDLSKIDLSTHVEITWESRCKARQGDGTARPVAEVIKERLNIVMGEVKDAFTRAKKRFNPSMTFLNVGIYWLYLLAGGVGHDSPNAAYPLQEALDKMLEPLWSGHGADLFGKKKDEIKEYLQTIIPRSFKNNTPWVLLSKRLRSEIMSKVNKVRDVQEDDQVKMRFEVDDLQRKHVEQEGRVTALEGAKGAANALSARDVALEQLSVSHTAPERESAEAPKEPGIAAVLELNEERSTYTVILKKGTTAVEVGLDDPRLDPEMTAACQLLAKRYEPLDYARLHDQVHVCILPCGHPDRGVCRYIAERRINGPLTKYTTQYDETFNKDRKNICYGGYRKCGDKWILAGTLLFKKVDVGLYVEFLATVETSALGRVLMKLLIKEAKANQHPLISLNSLVGTELRKKRRKSEADTEVAALQDKTYGWWTGAIGCHELTETNATLLAAECELADEIMDDADFRRKAGIPYPSDGSRTCVLTKKRFK